MKKKFSKYWRSSKQPRKQKKYLANATLKDRRKFLSAMLSKELRKKYRRRSIPVRKDDEVKIMCGQFRNIRGKIVRVFLKKSRIHVENVQFIKKDGSKTHYPIHPSNVMIVSLNLDDKERRRIFERIKNGSPKEIGGT